MRISKQANGNLRIKLTDTDLYNALHLLAESDNYGVAELDSLSDTASAQNVTTQYGGVEIVFGDEPES